MRACQCSERPLEGTVGTDSLTGVCGSMRPSPQLHFPPHLSVILKHPPSLCLHLFIIIKFHFSSLLMHGPCLLLFHSIFFLRVPFSPGVFSYMLILSLWLIIQCMGLTISRHGILSELNAGWAYTCWAEEFILQAGTPRCAPRMLNNDRRNSQMPEQWNRERREEGREGGENN